MTHPLNEDEHTAIRALSPGWWRPVAQVCLAVTVVLAGMWGALAWYTAMPGQSWQGPPPPLNPMEIATRDRLKAHVHMLATTIGPRHIGKPGTMRLTAGYIEAQLSGDGYTVSRLPVRSDEGITDNIQVHIDGTLYPEEIVVVGAHYDTVSMTPGADDNATGVAAVLELARMFKAAPQQRTVRFVLFTHEEPPYFKTDQMGSFVYAANARQNGEEVVAMLSLEMLGHFNEQPGSQTLPPPLGLVYPTVGNFVAFVATPESSDVLEGSIAAFRTEAKVASEAIAAPSWLEGVDFSDHWSFAQHGYPAVMVTDTAFMRNAHYHKASDTAEKIEYTYFTHTVVGLAPVIRALANK